MTLATTGPWDTAAASAAVGVLLLVQLDFTSGTQRLTNFPLDVTVLGYTWTGLGTVGSVGGLKESEDGAGETIEVSLSQVNASILALALGGVETYQGRAASIYVALLDAATLQITGTPILRFSGFMDVVSIKRNDDGAGDITMRLVSMSQDVRTNPSGLRYSDAQHQAEYPGELGFQYITELIGKPVQWLSKTFQQV